MASPHAVGVAALIVSQYGLARAIGPHAAARHHRVRSCGHRPTAHDCPKPNTFTYVRFVPQADGSIAAAWSPTRRSVKSGWFSNGFYGSGIVDALRAVRRPLTRPIAGSKSSADGRLRSAVAAARLAVGRGLDAVELGVLAAVRHQLLVRADLDDARAVEHDDEVGHAHGREPVRDEHGDAARRLASSLRADAA